MNKPLILKNTIQKYAWGSHFAIQKLTDTAPSKEPWAELWMGAHPKAPSKVQIDGQWVSLDDLISQCPEKILGEKTAKKFNNTLPYLFKVLAAELPLSIQAHPNATQAQIGFERESAAGLSLSAPTRNYKDNSHKPECICALTPFTGLKGFRKIDSAVELLEHFCPNGLAAEIENLKKKELKFFFQSLMELPDPQKKSIIQETVNNAEKHAASDLTSQWMIKLYQQYPTDIGVISPLFLNLFYLAPGQALFLSAGELHAYLDGLGIELMANSDNVLRGGLTPKHVDVPELLNILNFAESEIEILMPASTSACESEYPGFAEEFQLSVIHVSDSKTFVSPKNRSIEILLCTRGNAVLSYDSGTPNAINFKKGDSILIPAAVDSYRVYGNADVFKAGVPI